MANLEKQISRRISRDEELDITDLPGARCHASHLQANSSDVPSMILGADQSSDSEKALVLTLGGDSLDRHYRLS